MDQGYYLACAAFFNIHLVSSVLFVFQMFIFGLNRAEE